MKIAMCDLKKQYSMYKDEISEAINEVLEIGAYIGGPFVQKFEDEMKSYLNVNHAIACANGTDALMIALMALGIKEGDEIITTPFTFVATAEMIAVLGAKPVYVDVDPETYNIDTSKIEEKITDKTKAIIPVHIWGQSVDMDPIIEIASRYNLPVVEDNAQGIGSSYKGKMCGSIGDIATISFYPAKNLGAYGDGGMIVCRDDDMAEKIRMICNHGSKIRYHHEVLGLNSRLDGIQANILRVKLKYLDEENEKRRHVAKMYNELLRSEKIKVPFYADYGKSNIHQYGILVDDRDGLQQYLNEHQVPNAIHYPIPLHLQPAFLSDDQSVGSLPIAESISKKVLNLPIHPFLEDEEVHHIVDVIKSYVKE
jgi:dTDP-4-amino-4,6-dideoxygalactose transaminase